MGNTTSSERLQIPLQAQLKPVRLSDHSQLTTTEPVAVRIKISMWRSAYQVFDNASSELMFEIKLSGMLGSRLTLKTPDGTSIMSTKNKILGPYYRVYEGEETNQESFTVTVNRRIFKPLVILTEFEDKISGDTCRVFVEGDCSDTVSILYLERGSPELSTPETRENGELIQYQAIGRIHRYKARKEEYVEAAPGVDLTLLLVLWMVRYCVDLNEWKAPTEY